MIDKIILYLVGILLLASTFTNNLYIFSIICLLVTIFLLMKYGHYSDKTFIKPYVIRSTIIILMAYGIAVYGLGLIVGYSNNIFDTSLIGIIKNITPVILVIILEEYIRYVYSKRCQNGKKWIYIYITIVLFLIDMLTNYANISIHTLEELFIFASVNLIPCLFMHIACSYVTYKVSYVPAMILRVVTGIYIFILPIIPNLGNYLESVFGVILPYLAYKSTSNIIAKYDKADKTIIKLKNKYIYIPILILLVCLIFLISGLGKYKIVAIGSGSMEPVIYRGDAVIIDQDISLENLQIGDVLAHVHSNVVITHRIVGMIKENETYYFKTKGDNNDSVDDYIIEGKEVVGKVVYNIKYIGIPTVKLNEIFEKL